MIRRGIIHHPRARRLSKGVQALSVASDSQPVGLRIGDNIARELAYERVATLTPEEAWRIYAPPRTLGATEADQLAMDSHLQACGFNNLLTHAINLGMGLEEIAPQFLGYPYLAGLSQNGLIRAGVTTVAEEMTKRWVEVKRIGKSAKEAQNDEKVKTMTAALKDFGLQELFNEAAQKCDFDGGCLIYTDTGDRDNDAEQKEPLYFDASKLQGRVKRFTLVEAINLYPGLYNATDPLAPNYFTPDSWLVLGKQIHNSRFLYFTPNKVNMLLRPAYNFFGIPAAQLALDYVAHFTKTREAAQRLLTKFSLTVFKSDMAQIFNGGSAEMMDRRLLYLAQKRDNDAILLIDKEREDVIKLETPLGGVTDIVRQSLEFVAAIFRTTVVKLLGISPAGMNATGEYDDKNFLEHVGSKQEKILARPLEQVNKTLQMHLFGEIDPTIVIEFVPLSDEDDSQKATTKKTEADRDAVYLDRGVLDQREVRQRLSDDPDSDYGFINPEEVPEAPEGEEDMNGGAASASGTPGGMVDLKDEDQAGEVTAKDVKTLSFCSPEVANDDRWITVKPNGPEHRGQPALIGEGGEIKAGMGGKFNGKKLKEIGKKNQQPKGFSSVKSLWAVKGEGHSYQSWLDNVVQPESIVTGGNGVTYIKKDGVWYADRQYSGNFKKVDAQVAKLAEYYDNKRKNAQKKNNLDSDLIRRADAGSGVVDMGKSIQQKFNSGTAKINSLNLSESEKKEAIALLHKASTEQLEAAVNSPSVLATGPARFNKKQIVQGTEMIAVKNAQANSIIKKAESASEKNTLLARKEAVKVAAQKAYAEGALEFEVNGVRYTRQNKRQNFTRADG